MNFARKNPDYADIKLHMVIFKQERLDAIARVIEKEIMKPTAFQMKEDARIAREKAGKVKALKSLRLVSSLDSGRGGYTSRKRAIELSIAG